MTATKTNQKDAEKLFNENIKLVYFTIYHKFNNLTIDDDVIQEGMIGLWKASVNFDYSRNAKFASYAVVCIKSQILMYLRVCKRRSNIDNITQSLNYINEDGDAYDLNDVLADYSASSVDTQIVFFEELCKIKKDNFKAFRCLELCILGYPQRDIGKKLGLCQVQVSRILTAVKKSLESALCD